MKKSKIFLLSASALFVLASCTPSGVPKPSSAASQASGELSESLTSLESSSEVEGSGSVASSDRGTFNTSILGTAFSKSFSKEEWQMVSANPNIKMGVSTYNVISANSAMKSSTNNILIQAEEATTTKGVYQSSSASTGSLGGLGDLGDLGGLGVGSDAAIHANYNNISVVAGALSTILPDATNIVNQDANIYYCDNALYWDFLDENGNECTALSGLLDLVFERAFEAADPTSDIEFQHKGKIEIENPLISLLISSTIANLGSMWSSIDPMIQSLWQNGADMTTVTTSEAGTPKTKLEYETKIKITDPSILSGTLSDTLESSSGTAATLLGESSPLDDMSEEVEDMSDMFKTFEAEISFAYSATELKGMKSSVKVTADETKVIENILAEEGVKAGDSKLSLDSLEISQDVTFNYQDISLGLPASFDSYVTQELPETSSGGTVTPIPVPGPSVSGSMR